MSEAQADQSAAPDKPSAMPKVMVSGFVALVVAVETFIFFFMVPSADDVAALAEARLISKVEASMTGEDDEVIKEDDDTVEFPMGEYAVSFVPPGESQSYSVAFKLFCTIYAKDEKAMQELFTRKNARFQHRIMLEIRNLTTDELMENQLGLLQRRILATSIEVLEDDEKEGTVPVILGVPFYDFQVFQD